MAMKRKTVEYGLTASALIIVIAWIALTTGAIPLWAAEAVFVVAFPALVLTLGLWWRAGGGEEDFPFIGY